MRTSIGTRVAIAWGDLRDDLAGSDPGLLRLKMSMRGTASVVLSTIAAMLAGHFFGFPYLLCAPAITLSMMAPFLMREPTRRQRQMTLLVLALPVIGSTILTTVLHGHGPAGDSMFLVLVFLCFLLGPRNPRGMGIGLAAIVVTYVGLYLEPPPTTLGIQIASVVAVLPVIGFACFVLVPIDPAITLRRTVSAVQARAARVLRDARALGATPGEADPVATHRLRNDLLRLNEAALAADDQLALLEPGLAGAVRAKLIDVELWSARLVELLRNGAGSARDSQRLWLHARRIGRGGRYATQPGQFAPGTMLAGLVAMGSAVHALGQAARIPGSVTTVMPPAGPPTPGPLAWRMAFRSTLAAALAMAGGMALSPQRWFWAVMTVYVVFLTARTRGDTIHKGLQRLGGTLLGIVSGLVLSLFVAGDTNVELAVLVVSVFGMYYFFLVSYTVGIFFITVMLGLLYGMLGAPLETLLLLRLEETAIGAAAAIVVAIFVLPSRTRDQVERSGRALLAGLAGVVRGCASALSGQPGPAAQMAMRPIDRQVADLRLALAPIVAGRALLRRSTLERPVSGLLDCVQWVRMLAASAEAPIADPVARLLLSADAVRLADQLDALARGETPPDTGPLDAPEQGDAGQALHGLWRAMQQLEERIEIEHSAELSPVT